MTLFIASLALATAPVVLAAADIPVYLETTPGSALTIQGPLDSLPSVQSSPMRGTANQKWNKGSGGVWQSAQNPNYCMAFQNVTGDRLTVRLCLDLLTYRDNKRETTRDLKFHPTRSVAVDTSSRDAVLAFYNAQYSPGNPPPDLGFTGDVAGCNPGTTNPAFRAAVAQRVNFYRNLAGLSDVTQDDALSVLAQSAALMQAANGQLSHTPPNTWTCYTDVGAQASGKSNLALGTIGWNSIDAYVNEGGVLGHRRWVIFPGLQRFGTGDVPGVGNGLGANALYVITGDAAPANPQLRDGFTAWPPKGFIPYKFAYPTWSFSVPGADFTGATIAMTDGAGAAVTVNGAGPLQNGYGDNTYSFQPALPVAIPAPGGPDVPYTVTINNVMVKGAAQNYNYTVTLIDTNDPPSDLTAAFDFNTLVSPLPANSVFCKLTVVDGRDGSGYTFTLVDAAGNDDNGLFTVNGATLLNKDIVDFNVKKTFNVRLRADNGRANGTIEKAIVIQSPFNN